MLGRMRPLPDDLGPSAFRYRDAGGLGLTSKMLRGRRFARVTHGGYQLAEAATTDVAVWQALRRFHPQVALSCQSAAHAYNNQLDAGTVPHVTSPAQIRRTGLVAHRRRQAEITSGHGVELTTPRQTFLDLAAELDDLGLTIVGDGLCAATSLTPGQLLDFVNTHPPVPGLNQARRVAALVRWPVASPMETRVRRLIVAAGLPEPLVNDPARDGGHGWLAYVDLIYPQAKIAIEYQSEYHRTDRRQWRSDLSRMRALQEDGWLVLYLSVEDVRYPNRFLGPLRSALVSRGAL